MLQQSPNAGQTLDKGSTVTIVVSTYEEPEPDPPTPDPVDASPSACGQPLVLSRQSRSTVSTVSALA